MNKKIIKDTEEALKYYEKIKDHKRIKILKEGILHYIKHHIKKKVA